MLPAVASLKLILKMGTSTNRGTEDTGWFSRHDLFFIFKTVECKMYHRLLLRDSYLSLQVQDMSHKATTQVNAWYTTAHTHSHARTHSGATYEHIYSTWMTGKLHTQCNGLCQVASHDRYLGRKPRSFLFERDISRTYWETNNCEEDEVNSRNLEFLFTSQFSVELLWLSGWTLLWYTMPLLSDESRKLNCISYTLATAEQWKLGRTLAGPMTHHFAVKILNGRGRIVTLNDTKVRHVLGLLWAPWDPLIVIVKASAYLSIVADCFYPTTPHCAIFPMAFSNWITPHVSTLQLRSWLNIDEL